MTYNKIRRIGFVVGFVFIFFVVGLLKNLFLKVGFLHWIK